MQVEFVHVPLELHPPVHPASKSYYWIDMRVMVINYILTYPGESRFEVHISMSAY
jgi:hypothetical protein